MAKVKIAKPFIITLEFYQEKQDEDYGTCLYANFIIDKKNYRLNIVSDCGNYVYSWTPTPKHESFFHLLSRIDGNYLLNKLGDITVIDVEDTYNNIKTYLKSFDENESLENLGIEEKELYTACKQPNSCAIFDSIRTLINFSKIHNKTEDYGIITNISRTYPKSLKKLVEVFIEHIQPFIRENLL